MRARLAALAGALLLLCGCAGQQLEAAPAEAFTWDALPVERSMETGYANQFTVSYCANGYLKITIGSSDRYLVVPEGAQAPDGILEDVTVLQQPLDNIYLAATSAMDLFRGLDAVGAVTLSGLPSSGWYVAEARQAMEEGRMEYAGKYSAPDYERILSMGCDLAVESTMIYHAPEVKEQLERLGIPVLVERSSYESHPLGRMEWMKLYAALLGKDGEAEAYFDALERELAPVLQQENTGKTVAFFYITSNGAVNVRKPGDYIAKAIGLAGGVYALDGIAGDGTALSTMNLQMEAFFDAVHDADVLIYNSAIDGGLQTIAQLLEKGPVLSGCRAVREGQVWCTGKNLFQESLGTGKLILDLHRILTGEALDDGELTYLHRLT